MEDVEQPDKTDTLSQKAESLSGLSVRLLTLVIFKMEVVVGDVI
jgi:hypothetical protein